MKREKQGSDVSRSDYDWFDVVAQREFQDLAAQIDLSTHQRQHLIDNLYGNNSWSVRQDKFTRNPSKQPESSVYLQAYQKWKEESSSGCGFNQTYQSTLSLLNKHKQSSQITRLMKQYRVPEAVYSYNENSKEITGIKDLYAKQLENLIRKDKLESQQSRQGASLQEPFKRRSQSQLVREVQMRNKLGQVATKQKMVELAVQKELLQRIRKINEEEQLAEDRLKKEQQLQKTCFVQMIKNPPPEAWRNKQDKDIPSYQAFLKRNIQENRIQSQQAYNQTAQCPLNESCVSVKHPEPKYKLNIESILKIPYNDNYRQILGLASPEEMKKINQYRDQALQREEALESLKKKVASYGPEKIAQLSAPARQKLFRILYEKEVNIQRSFES